jgi:hypothetical protein
MMGGDSYMTISPAFVAWEYQDRHMLPVESVRKRTKVSGWTLESESGTDYLAIDAVHRDRYQAPAAQTQK